LRATPLRDTDPEQPLTRKQRRFVDEYLLDMNATAAARRAGYGERSAAQNGHGFLRRPNVAAAIEARLAERRERMAVTTERVIRELARIAFADMGRIMTWSGEALIATPSALLSEDDRAAIAEIAVVKRKNGDVAARVVLHDKERALEALCRFLGLFGPRGGLEAGLIENPSAAAERIREMIRAKHAKLFAPEEAGEQTQGHRGGYDAERRDADTEATEV
jgi:phage terminase small subunit